MAQKFSFFRAGGADQARLEDAAELASLADLDQKLWVALSCPTDGLDLDPKTLALIDTDHDGRIRPPEVLAAVDFVCRVLKDPARIKKRSSKLPLAAIKDDDEDGKRLLASAKQILKDLGHEGDKEITVDEVLDTKKIFEQTRFNGDGIVPPTCAEDPSIRTAIEDVMRVVGSEEDRSGKPGVSKDKLDLFFTQALALDAWWKDEVLPLADKTDGAADAVLAVRAKVDDYFVRCRLAAFDARASVPLNRSEADYAALAGDALTAESARVAEFPIARIEASRALPLDVGVNPAWAIATRKLATDAIAPALGARPALSETDWANLLEKLAPNFAWRAKKPATTIDALGKDRIRELASGDYRAKIDALVAEDLALAPEAAAIAHVEQLLRYNRDLHTLLCNFVSFRDFYARAGAIFQAGTLYVDERSCDLCIRIQDVAAHSALAGLSNTYLLYCDCARKDADGVAHKMTIVVAMTAGATGQIRAGRNGVFYDRAGHDWDATIVKIIEQPISVRQAFFLPYVRLGRFIGEQIDKFASARDTESHDVLTGKASPDVPVAPVPVATAHVAPAAPAAPAPGGFDVAKFAGIFAALGLAIGAIGSTLVAIMTGFVSLRWWEMPLALIALMFVISGPSMLIAWLKLRHRNLGPILDGASWAVNAEVKVSVAFGRALTNLAQLPPGSEHSTEDPYADKSRAWMLWVFLFGVAAIGAAAKLGYLKPLLAAIFQR